ncbi:hypothetical protein BG006_007661 [Podila minutissima]|uniref:Uncharacterized protein n=1 Tax=Podila minutissima TaxID=64525 RepID=A0A9P5SHI7_9FUNG|nr:hypothetical protein BG006_007661 [Podila minutissima]
MLRSHGHQIHWRWILGRDDGVLRTLAFTTNYHCFYLDDTLLAQCPALQSVNICNTRPTFDPAARFWSELVFLPGSRHVALGGDGALGFNMETFDTPLARSIDLALCEAYKVHNGPGSSNSHNLPNSPHHWSWKWDLPCLNLLNLSAGFGSLFEFRMLDRCPTLETLILSLYGSDAPPEGRTMIESDLRSPSRLTASGYMLRTRTLNNRGEVYSVPDVVWTMFPPLQEEG